MKNRSFDSMIVVAGVMAVLWLVPARIASQQLFSPDAPRRPGAKTWLEGKAKLPPYSPPRTADGHPDLQGRWGGGLGSDSIEEIPKYIDITTPPAESWVSDPSDGVIPYQPWALAKRNEIRAGLARGWPGETGEHLYADPQTFCLSSVPRTQGGLQIIQRPGSVVFIKGRTFRVIPTDGRPHISKDVKFWMGNSVGSWEGDTLVIDVTSLNGKMWLDSVGDFFSANAHLVERLRMVDANTIDYEITIDDPTVFTRPWKLNHALRRAGAPAGGRGVGLGAGGGGGAGGALGPAVGNVVLRDDPYANEVWENACYEGNTHHVEGAQSLGFKWFTGVVPPAH